MTAQSLTPVQIWWLAIRPRTLPAAAAPVLIGAAAAYAEGHFQLLPAVAALIVGLLLQIGANLANDAYDFQRGADTARRLGPRRVTQAGLLTARQVLAGMWLVFGLAALPGLYLVWIAGWPALVIGLLAIVSAIVYTGGPFPLGYYGLGDLFVFLFFGLAAVGGTVYVQAGTVSALALACAVPAGLLTVAILVVNNLRDIETDRAAGKHTLAVRFGAGVARREYAACIYGAYLCAALLPLVGLASPWALLPWLSLPLAVRLIGEVNEKDGAALNPLLARTGQVELIFAVLLSAGLLL